MSICLKGKGIEGADLDLGEQVLALELERGMILSRQHLWTVKRVSWEGEKPLADRCAPEKRPLFEGSAKHPAEAGSASERIII